MTIPESTPLTPRAFVQALLAKGPRAARDVEAAGKLCGISRAALSKAASRLGVVSRLSGFPARATWALPAERAMAAYAEAEAAEAAVETIAEPTETPVEPIETAPATVETVPPLAETLAVPAETPPEVLPVAPEAPLVGLLERLRAGRARPVDPPELPLAEPSEPEELVVVDDPEPGRTSDTPGQGIEDAPALAASLRAAPRPNPGLDPVMPSDTARKVAAHLRLPAALQGYGELALKSPAGLCHCGRVSSFMYGRVAFCPQDARAIAATEAA